MLEKQFQCRIRVLRFSHWLGMGHLNSLFWAITIAILLFYIYHVCDAMYDIYLLLVYIDEINKGQIKRNNDEIVKDFPQINLS